MVGAAMRFIGAPMPARRRLHRLVPLLGLLAPAAAWAAEPDAFEARVRDYLLAHPEVVVEALDRFRASRRGLVRAVENNPVIARSASLFTDPGDPWLGDPEGDVTLVAFTAYDCGPCRRAAPVLRRLLERDPGLRIVFKQLPGPGAGPYVAALAALAAGRQGRFAALDEALLNANGGLDADRVLTVAEHVGLDPDRLRRDMGDPALGARIERTRRLARELEVEAAPAFVVGTEVAHGPKDLRALEVLIARARLP